MTTKEMEMANESNRRDFLKYMGIAGSGALLANQLTWPASRAWAAEKLKESVKIPLWWSPHEIAGAKALFDAQFTPKTGTTVNLEFIPDDGTRTAYFSKIFSTLVSGSPYDLLTFNADDAPRL